MKLLGYVDEDKVSITRKRRESKYDTYVAAIQNAKPGKRVQISLQDEENGRSAAARTVVAIRKCAIGKIDCRIKSSYDDSTKTLYLWETDVPLTAEDDGTPQKNKGGRPRKNKENNVATA